MHVEIESIDSVVIKNGVLCDLRWRLGLVR